MVRRRHCLLKPSLFRIITKIGGINANQFQWIDKVPAKYYYQCDSSVAASPNRNCTRQRHSFSHVRGIVPHIKIWLLIAGVDVKTPANNHPLQLWSINFELDMRQHTDISCFVQKDAKLIKLHMKLLKTNLGSGRVPTSRYHTAGTCKPQ
jgi:hypothetical protein